MKEVNVKLEQIEVKQFNPRTEKVQFSVLYNDGVERGFTQEVRVSNPEALASSMLKQIRSEVRSRAQPTDDDSPLAGIINVRIEYPDIEEIHDRVEKFFSKISNGIKNAKLERLSWIDMQHKIEGIKVLF